MENFFIWQIILTNFGIYQYPRQHYNLRTYRSDRNPIAYTWHTNRSKSNPCMVVSFSFPSWFLLSLTSSQPQSNIYLALTPPPFCVRSAMNGAILRLFLWQSGLRNPNGTGFFIWPKAVNSTVIHLFVPLQQNHDSRVYIQCKKNGYELLKMKMSWIWNHIVKYENVLSLSSFGR